MEWKTSALRAAFGRGTVVGVALGAVALGIAATPPQPTSVAQSVPAGWAKVVAFYRDGVEKAGIVGSSLLLIRDGAVVARETAGYADLEARRPVDADTIFHWASITKTFTGIAIMQLRDRGLLKLDDPILKYVPELRAVHNPFGDMSQITLKHLMSHSAGFRAGTWPWGGDKPWHPFEPPGWAQVAAMLPYTEILFQPGSRYSYSNPGVIFLGRVIEALSGDDYEMYVTKNILMPLGMHRSFFDRAPYHLAGDRSHSYFRNDQGLREARFDFDTGITVSNGGLNAPLDDMAKYLRFLLGGAHERGAYDGVLKRSSLEEMWVPLVRAEDGEGGSGSDVHAALSFFVERHQGLEFVAHSGNQNGFISHFYLHLPTRTAYIVSFNTDVVSKEKGGTNLTRALDNDLRDVLIEEIISVGRTNMDAARPGTDSGLNLSDLLPAPVRTPAGTSSLEQ
ncbi:MAG: serine hydrolase domain-containing protein [Vicinamibacterales bacterium]